MLYEKCIHDNLIVFSDLEKYGFPFTHTCDCADLNVMVDFLLIATIINIIWCCWYCRKCDREKEMKEQQKKQKTTTTRRPRKGGMKRHA